MILQSKLQKGNLSLDENKVNTNKNFNYYSQSFLKIYEDSELSAEHSNEQKTQDFRRCMFQIRC